MKVKRFRDLTLIDQENDKILVIACDSSGGIGNKPEDIVKVPEEIVGYYAARVAIMEVLSIGAEILTVIDTLSVEMEPTGRRIIQGIERLLQEAGIDTIALNGSTEENIPTCQTAMGITVIGEVHKKDVRANKSKKGDYVVVLGIPKVGNEVIIPFDEEICSIKELQNLLRLKEVKEIYPVGSKGILYEVNCLARSNQRELKILENQNIDLKKSAGPATVIIFTVNPKDISKVQEKIEKPLEVIGELI